LENINIGFGHNSATDCLLSWNSVRRCKVRPQCDFENSTSRTDLHRKVTDADATIHCYRGADLSSRPIGV